jgi:2-oxoglutarate dehydrogenase complex dehydrogenase (E1) component-like enzyme
LRREGKQVLRLIDATPIPLTSLHKWADWNGRTRGLKAHLTYDPDADRPVRAEITAATVNDVVVGRRQPIEPGATYVFDKAYVDNEVAYHKTVNSALSNTLIPDAQNAELKSLLQSGLKLFQAHLDHAEQLATQLQSAKS